MGAVPVVGTAAGNDVKVTADINIQGMALTFAIDGKVNGDAMDGSVKVGDFGEFPSPGSARRRRPLLHRPLRQPLPPAPPQSRIPNGKWDVKFVIPAWAKCRRSP